jgi:hypothetical protein
VKISFEYHVFLGFSRVLLNKNRYSCLLMKKGIKMDAAIVMEPPESS